MIDETRQSMLIDEYFLAFLGEDKTLLDQSIKNLHKLESTVEPEIIQPFLELSKSGSPYLREAAVAGLGEFGDYNALPCIPVELAVYQALEKIDMDGFVDPIIQALQDKVLEIRIAAANALRSIGYHGADELITEALPENAINTAEENPGLSSPPGEVHGTTCRTK